MSTFSRLLVPIALILGTPLAAAQVNGAVYTTDVNGVAEDSFPTGPEVYLAGGPTPSAGCAGIGLADGLYYFQVTDPSGATLLSGDRLPERVVRVVGGVFESASSSHAVANGPCGSKVVQLFPFRRAPNGGGEYKAWLTPVGSHVPGGPNFGFLSDKSKAAFFRLQSGPPVQEVAIEGTVYFDFDEDGVYDPGGAVDVPIPGWRVEIDGLGVTFSDQDGHYAFIRDEGTQHVLDSIAPAPGYVGVVDGRWAPTSPISVQVVAAAPVTTVDFGLLFASGQEWRRVINSLCLRSNSTVPYPPPDPDPTIFKVPETGPFEDAFDALFRFVGAPSNNVLANILSKEYAAACLNTSVGPLADKATYVDRFGDSVLVPFEVLADDSSRLLCNPKSCDTGPNGDPAWLALFPGSLNALIGMNSSGKNVYTRDSAFPSFASPY